MLVALTSARGSPGVTAAALALTLSWHRGCVLAECDPAGGSALAGFLAGRVATNRGIGELAVSALRGDHLASQWWGQVIDLTPPERQRLLLPGVQDPAQAATLDSVWTDLAALFAGLAPTNGYDVIADCGRIVTPHAPWPVMAVADVVLLVLPATVPGLAAAAPVIGAMRARMIGDRADTQRLGLLLCGHSDQPARTASSVLDAPVVAVIAGDDRTARVLSHGGTIHSSRPLMRAARLAARQIADYAQHLNAVRQAVPQFLGEGNG